MGASSDRNGYRMFVASSLVLAFSYGVAVGVFHLFPYAFVRTALEGLGQLNGGNFVVYYHPVRDETWQPIVHTDSAYEGANLVTRLGPDDRLVAEIIDMQGKPIHRWDTDWFTLWPDAEHVPSEIKPRSRPGCQIHGAAVMPDGDLVFNFDYLGLVRLDKAGDVVWRLPYQTHHSVHVADDGNLWVCGQVRRHENERVYPYRQAPYDASTILEVSPEGRILKEWSVEKLLRENDRAGLLGLSRGFVNGYAKQDILHMNDVEPFPASLEEGFFKKGDVLVSLRNISTMFVFERETGRIKFVRSGQMVWQHDPDFIDGNRIAVFDNKGGGAAEGNSPSSRILVFSADEETADVRIAGNAELPFYTKVMGKHQWLPNGNVLITETEGGRAFEIDEGGRIVWQYVNFVGPKTVGIVEQVTRLPLSVRHLYEASQGVARSEAAVDINEG